MQFSTLAHLAALLGVAAAVPQPAAAPLSFDDVILVSRDGNHKVIKDAEYQSLTKRGLLQPAPARRTGAFAKRASPPPGRSRYHNKKRCDESKEVQVTSDDEFLNWDMAVSPVVSAAGGSVTVGVSAGYSIGNSVQVSSTVGATVEGLLSVSLSVSYSETWTTTEGSSISYEVPAGQNGLIVSQAMVRRVVGNFLGGCSDAPTSEPFTSDTYSSKNYGNMEWVTGLIRLCNSTEYPVPYCIGDGTHS